MPTGSASSSLPLSSLIPARTNRALLVGQTGSGKTTLARWLLASRRYQVVIDGKGTLKWDGYEHAARLERLTKLKSARLIYRPSYDALQDVDEQERLWQWLYERGNTTVYVDETASVTDGDIYPYYYGACLMRGRERGIELWSATQRPLRIPQVCLSESENVYAFRLRLPQDRQRVEQLTGIPARRIHALPKRHFLYAPQDGDVSPPLTLSLG